MKPCCCVPALVCLAALLPFAVAAHNPLLHAPAHTHGGWAGFLHPFTGLDHLLAMLAAGLWAAQHGGRARWALPMAFAGAAGAGLLAGLAGLRLPAVEALVLLSVAVFGVALAAARRWPLSVGAALAGSFAFAHGLAHGQELTSASGLGYLTGFMAGTAALLAAGVGLGGLVLRARAASWLRLVGGGIAAAAVVLAVR